MTIVVGYSPDIYGRAALAHAVDLAREKSDRLVVVNATPGTALVDDRFATDADIAAITGDLGDLDLEVLHEVVADVADAVLAVAKAEEARLVVVGVRRRSPVGKLIMGSVAQRVILEAACPVLAVKP